MQSQDLNDPRKQFPLPEEKVLDLDPSEALFHLENGDVIGCLLYTSPSPRDRG